MKLKLLIIFCALFEFAYTQNTNDKDQFFVFDKNWKAADMKKAVYFLRVRQVGDSNWEWLYYNIFGPRIKLEKFKDLKATIKNGKFTYYYPNGSIDSSGKYLNSELDGDWYFRNEKGQITRKKTYNSGLLLTDSFYAVQNTDTLKKYQLKPGEVESEYPGGQAGWLRFLNRNLHYPDRAINSNSQGEVRLQFIVDASGNIIDPEVNKSVEYSLDEEALRIIILSDKWTPAVQRGRNVKSYKIQPIIFKLSAE